MSRRLTTAIATLALFTLACQGRLFSIRVDGTSDARVPKGSILEQITGDLGFSGFTAMDLIDSAELQNQGVEPGDIEESELTVFSLKVTDPPDGDLSFLESMELYVEAPDVPRTLVASQSEFPEGVREVDFDLTGADLTDYIVSRELTLTTAVRGNRPEDDTTIEATWEVRVGVTGQGACNAIKGERVAE